MTAVGSDLLGIGQSIIAGLKDTTGQGSPEQGEAFGRAQSAFAGVNETLRSAVPEDGWVGAGAFAYADQNTRQQLRSEAMADADRQVHKVLERQADQIALRRGHLDDQYNLLATMRHVTLPLQVVPHYGEAMKLAVQMAAVQTAVGESCRQMIQLQSEMARNAADLQQAVGRYSSVADGADLRPAAADLDSDRLQMPVATRLDSENPPGPPAGTPLQDGR
jgi:hypothetical protein